MPARIPPRRERSIEAACVRYAKSKGCIVLKLRPPPRGVPDRLFLLPKGRVWFVEFKRPDGRMTGSQMALYLRLSSERYHIDVCRTVEHFRQALDQRLKAR